MSYAVKSCFRTLQGEGAQAGRVAVFCRFAGCNLWSGRERDRPAATCSFCDTDFVGTDGDGGGVFETAASLAARISETWGSSAVSRYVVFTGGEPLLQLDEPLILACRREGFEVGIETNGTLRCPPGIDWICVSPKAGAPLRQRSGHELKLVHPQPGVDPEDFEGLDFQVRSLQPMDGPDRERNTQLCVDHCLEHPNWRLSLQLHKWIGIP